MQVNFNGAKTIDEINIYGVKDDYLSTVPPTTATGGTNYGITAFQVQYWNGSGWITIPNGNVTGNTNVLRKFTFSPITTTGIRVVVTGAQDGFSRIVELEAWGGGTASGSFYEYNLVNSAYSRVLMTASDLFLKMSSPID